MTDITVNEVLDKLPVTELEHSLQGFLKPMMDVLPDKRLQRLIFAAVSGLWSAVWALKRLFWGLILCQI